LVIHSCAQRIGSDDLQDSEFDSDSEPDSDLEDSEEEPEEEAVEGEEVVEGEEEVEEVEEVEEEVEEVEEEPELGHGDGEWMFQGRSSYRPLHVACEIGSGATVDALLRRGANPNARTVRHHYIIHAAFCRSACPHSSASGPLESDSNM
jgi:hypothetical protein